jgi:hypothetical protein
MKISPLTTPISPLKKQNLTFTGFELSHVYLCTIWQYVYRQVVGILLSTNCAPIIAYLFLYCYESQFMAKIQ